MMLVEGALCATSVILVRFRFQNKSAAVISCKSIWRFVLVKTMGVLFCNI